MGQSKFLEQITSVNASHLFFHLGSLSPCAVFARQLISPKTSSSPCVPKKKNILKVSPISHSSASANGLFSIWSQKVAHLDQKKALGQTKGSNTRPAAPFLWSSQPSEGAEPSCVTLRMNVVFHDAQCGHVATADYSGAVGNRGGGESFVTVP